MVCFQIKCKLSASGANPQHEIPKDWETRKKCIVKLREGDVKLAKVLKDEKAKCDAGKPSKTKCCRSHYKPDQLVDFGPNRRRPKKGAVPMSPSEEAIFFSAQAQQQDVETLLGDEIAAPGKAVRQLRRRTIDRPLTTAELTAQLSGAQTSAVSAARSREASCRSGSVKRTHRCA